MTEIRVLPEAGDRYRIGIRGHEVLVDQPLDDGGTDTAPTPTELFVAGLVSCVAFYAGRFLRRHDLPSQGLEVVSEFAFAPDRPARVGKVSISIRLPKDFPEARRTALLAVVEHCTVHNSLLQPPEVGIALVEVAKERRR
jgi:uncharacterized OsmC-like protein